MLPDIRDYSRLYESFRWQVPPAFNIAQVCCDRWAEQTPQAPAIIDMNGAEPVITSFAAMQARANRFANMLARQGVRTGDRVGILMPQAADVAIAHMGIYKLGAVAVPLAILFGVDAIEYRLRDAGIKALITDAGGLAKLRQIAELPATLECVFCADGASAGALDLAGELARSSEEFATAATTPDTPGMMVYTSGTTGAPKGALHGHRVLLGHIPGTQYTHDFLPQAGDRLWTPADWAWAGGLLNILLPGLYFGLPVVAKKFERFDAEGAFDLMARAGVRNAFIPPTALRMLRPVENPRAKFKLALRSIASGGESLGAEVFQWGREALGLTINEFYGQTECNQVLGSCGAIGVNKPGWIGRAVPGHKVAIIDAEGRPCKPGESGQISMLRPDPVMFLEYWNRPDATAAKYLGDWMVTGDQGVMDEEGYVTFFGRDDDVITSSGYRIGPGEIEDCLIRHPAVALAAAVGKPDALRTEIVKAYITLRPGYQACDALSAEIQAFVRTRLSAHEYPREIAFIDDMPLTTTGKIIRRELRARG
ncbi:MAG: AMP-binding protein [Alphaproteobacteria bacterium]|nr:AMP-binding protein [Alphaproteobacteria bacterium]